MLKAFRPEPETPIDWEAAAGQAAVAMLFGFTAWAIVSFIMYG